ncbi:MAG: hypothetical protein HYZ44_03740 [Bacteroidetes bacterium]|nr:hypothetical protein [Bacteroidota bacterium]
MTRVTFDMTAVISNVTALTSKVHALTFNMAQDKTKVHRAMPLPFESQHALIFIEP